MTEEEINLLALHLDKNQDKRISYPEFEQRMLLKNYEQVSHKYTISLRRFVETVLAEWFMHRGEERIRLTEILKNFDENGDNTFSYDEWRKMLKSWEPGIPDDLALLLYKSALDGHQHKATVDVSYSSLVSLIVKYRIGGFGKIIFQEWFERY